MLHQKFVPLEDREEWNRQLKNISYAPAHTWIYNKAIALSSKLETFLYCASTTIFKAVCPIAVREKLGQRDIVTPYGFGGFISRGNHIDFHRNWHAFIASTEYICGYIALHPFFCNLSHFQYAEMNATTKIYSLNLQQSSETLFNQLAKIHRYELKQWKNSNVKIILDPTRLKIILPDLYKQTLLRANASTVYHFSTETLFNIVDNDAVMIGAEINGEIEAISIFLYTPHIADYFLNASTINGRYHTRGLLWSAIAILKELNIPILNLGGGIKPNDGLDDFKRRFGGKLSDYNVLKEVYNDSAFKKLCQQAGVNQLANYPYFPPYYNTT